MRYSIMGINQQVFNEVVTIGQALISTRNINIKNNSAPYCLEG